MRNQKGFAHIFIILIIILFVVVGVFIYRSKISRLISRDTSNSSQTVSINRKEIAVHKIYESGKQVSTLEEINQRYKDGSLETKIESNGKTLSHTVFSPKGIYRFINNKVKAQKYKDLFKGQYLTNGERVLQSVLKSKNVNLTQEKLGGKNVKIYSLKSKNLADFSLVKQAYAQEDAEDTIKVVTDTDTGALLQVQFYVGDSDTLKEDIQYQADIIDLQATSPKGTVATSEPFLDLPPLPDYADLPPLPDEVIDAPVLPDIYIYMQPTVVIPTSSGYNNQILQIYSTLFNRYTEMQKQLKENGSFGRDYVRENVKVRIDGVVKAYDEGNLDPNFTSAFKFNVPQEEIPWIISNQLPANLTPGYHTVEVYLEGVWYLAPNLLVAPQTSTENVIEITGGGEEGPIQPVYREDKKAWEVKLKGKNFVKPFTVSLTSPGATTVVLDDKNVEVQGTENLILTIPLIQLTDSDILYGVTIEKEGQRLVSPNLFFISNNP